MAKYLDNVQFARVWAKITTLLATKADKATTLAGYGITDAYTKEEVDAKLSAAVHYKGAVATYADLPTNAEIGDMYDVTANGHNYCWNGKEWDDLGGLVDLSSYYTKTEVDNKLANKVDKVSGKGLSTEDFTTALKTKLTGIADGAQVNVLEGVQLDGVDLTIASKKVNIALADKFDAKVDKETGKGLSTNDYDDTEKANVASNTSARHTHSNKTVLDGITAALVSQWNEGQANVIEEIQLDGTKIAPSSKKVNIALADKFNAKVDKVDGKALSTNDFTNAYKTKLDGIAANAQINVIEDVTLNGAKGTLTSKTLALTVDIPEVEAMTEADIDAIINA